MGRAGWGDVQVTLTGCNGHLEHDDAQNLHMRVYDKFWKDMFWRNIKYRHERIW